jgi:putative membrane protein insertion efficiency factor
MIKQTGNAIERLARGTAHCGIRFYQLTFSALIGRQCRHMPSCSEFMDDAIGRHGLWIGGWMGLARLCRCHPWGTDGYDPVPPVPPSRARWYRPWRYGAWTRLPGAEASDAMGDRDESRGSRAAKRPSR